MTPEKKNPECVLCKTPIPGGTGVAGRFCCTGCEKVYQVLSSLDESSRETYLKTAIRLGVVPGGGGLDSKRSQFQIDPGSVKRERFSVDGLACPSCAWVIEQVLLSVDGLEEARVDYITCSADVSYDMRQTSPEELGAVLTPLGYSLETIRDQALMSKSKKTTFNLVVSSVLTMNLMMLAFVRYGERLQWIDSVPGFLPWAEMMLALPVLYLGWLPMVGRAFWALRHKRLTMDLLLSIGVFASLCLSLTSLFLGGNDIYFETSAGLITIALLSRMIEERLRARAASDLAPLLNMKVVHVKKVGIDGHIDHVHIESINKGDTTRFHRGETIPFDGEAVGSQSLVSEAVLTGEPEPVSKVRGDIIVAGSEVVDGETEVRVMRTFEDTRLYEIAESLRRTLTRSESEMRLADRISSWFVPAVLGVALVSFGIRYWLYGAEFALSAKGFFPSVAVLVVACPCAFSIAGIAAITAATSTLIGKGILVREPNQLELLAGVDTLIFDKTGTVTKGEMDVVDVVWRGEPEDDLLPIVLAAERGSPHPVAHAIRECLEGRDVEALAVDLGSVEDFPGRGRVLETASISFSIGSAALFDDVFRPKSMAPCHSAVWFGKDRRASGCFLIADSVKSGAGEMTALLKDSRLGLILLSGDRQEVTDDVARSIGIERAFGDQSMEDKVAFVKQAKQSGGSVAFVGDGTNDALAMNEADVSIALSKSTDEALLASGIVVMGGDLLGIALLFKTGKRLYRVIKSNYLWACLFNGLFIPVAAAGKLVPLFAMLLMLISSSTVLLNSLRMRK